MLESDCHGLTGDLGIIVRLGRGGRDIADGREQAPGETVLAVFQGNARTHHLLEKRLDERRHRAVPQGKDENDMPRRNDRISRRHQRRRQLPRLEFLLRAQQREVEPGKIDPRHLTPGGNCTLHAGIGEGMAQRPPPGSGWSWIIVTRPGMASPIDSCTEAGWWRLRRIKGRRRIPVLILRWREAKTEATL